MIRERISFIDFGRVTCIFLVIVLHSCLGSYYLFVAQHGIDWFVTLFYYTISRISVPVFVMISGITTIWLKKTENKPVTIDGALKRIKNLLFPILFWSIVYIFLFNNFSLKSLVSILWSPQGLVHLWFLYMLIGLYILSPLVSQLFNSEEYNLIKYLIVLWFIFSSINVYAAIILGINLGEWFGLLTNYQGGFVGYYILGAYIMSRAPLSLFRSIALALLGLTSSYILVTLDNHNSPIFNDRFLNFLSPNVVIMSYGVIEILRNIDFSWFKHYRISYISPLVIDVYLTHEMVLKFFREHLGLVGHGHNALYFIPLMAISAFIISLIISFILSKIQRKRKLFF